MPERQSGLYLGEFSDGPGDENTGESVGLEPEQFNTHGVIVGMTGSGKTGLGVVLLEEALAANIPTLIIDPKGDMGNLLLSFPSLAASDFAPWIPPGEDAEATAATWRDGLAGWGITPDQIASLRDRHSMTVYTPGSTAGIPLNLIGSMAPPGTGENAELNLEAARDEAEALVQGLLGLIDVTSDPLSGREHVLLANIIELAWAAGETIDMSGLLTRIVDPPMRKLGVLDIDTFFPKADRSALAMKLNGLLASPSFQAWGTGAPLDIESMLWDEDGAAKSAIVYMAHLSDSERQMVVTRLLSKVVAWMRTQPGSTKLRALIYMDEVYGFAPPTAEPPSKKPILTILKQARAFGVGLVLATQNPVDIDYKAISNAGTWMIGRLQTERDKQRLLEGMSSASGAVDISAVDDTISSLPKREFLLHSTKAPAPRTFGVRWAMSYLAGPISKDQIKDLPGQPTATQAQAAAPAEPQPQAGAADPAPTSDAGAPVLSDSQTAVMPTVADSTQVKFLDSAAPWATEFGIVSPPPGTSPVLAAAVAMRVELLYDDTASDLRHTETYEVIVSPLSDNPASGDFRAVDYDDRDFRSEAPAGAIYELPNAKIKNKTFFTGLQTALKDDLVRNKSTTISGNKALKLYGRVGETREEFAARCQKAAEDAKDEDAKKLRDKLETKMDRIKDAIEAAELKARQLEDEASQSKTSEMISGATSVLGALFGGRKSASSIGSAVRRASSGRSRSQKASNRMEAALQRVDEKTGDLEGLEMQLEDELVDIVEHWDDVAAEIEEIEVPLEKSDVSVTDVVLVWMPTT